jgi:hypothetical protein
MKLTLKKEPKDKGPVKKKKTKSKGLPFGKGKKKGGNDEEKEKVSFDIKKVPLFLYTQFPSFYTFLSGGNPPQLDLETALKVRKVEKPLLPQVNLLPSHLALIGVKRNTRRGIIFIVVALASLLGVIYVGQGTAIGLANQSLLTSKAQVATSQERANTYQPIGAYFDSLQGRLEIAAAQIGSQIDFPKISNYISSKIPTGISLGSLNVVPLVPNADPAQLVAQCGPVDDFFNAHPVPILACVNFSGNFNSPITLIQFQKVLAAGNILTNVSVQAQGASPAGAPAPYKGTAAITTQAVLAGGR